jgi:RNA recognition motif-containing protein
MPTMPLAHTAQAIVDRNTSQCKGYGFVMFERETSARAAIQGLIMMGVSAAYARVSRAQLEMQGRIPVDPTNLYVANLPFALDENQVAAGKPGPGPLLRGVFFSSPHPPFLPWVPS